MFTSKVRIFHSIANLFVGILPSAPSSRGHQDRWEGLLLTRLLLLLLVWRDGGTVGRRVRGVNWAG